MSTVKRGYGSILSYQYNAGGKSRDTYENYKKRKDRVIVNRLYLLIAGVFFNILLLRLLQNLKQHACRYLKTGQNY